MHNLEIHSSRMTGNNSEIECAASDKNISIMGNQQIAAEIHNKDEWMQDLINEINNLRPKMANVIRQRAGLDQNGNRIKCQTLEAIGSGLGLTRERIRQIEKGALAQMETNPVWSEKLKPGVEWLMTKSGASPRSLADLEQHMPWFKGASENHEIMAYLMAQPLLSGEKTHLVEFNNQFYASPLSRMNVSDMIKNSIKSLELSAKNKCTEGDALDLFGKMIPVEMSHLVEIIWVEAARHVHVVHITGDESQPKRLVSLGRSSEAMAMKVLSESTTPLHYSALPALLSQAGFEVNERRIHAAANTVAYIYGQGVYGVIEHHSFTSDQRKQIHDLTLRLVKSKEWSGSRSDLKQWSCLDLINLLELDRSELVAILGDKTEKLNQYLLNISLSEGSGFVYIGRNLWRMAIAKEKNQPRDIHGFITRSKRINIKDSLERLIIEAGQPVLSKVIKDTLNEKRSVTQVPYHRAFNGDLIKIDKDRWGLLGRDVVINKDELERWEAESRKVIASQQGGISANDLWEKTRARMRDGLVDSAHGPVENIHIFMSLLARAGLIKGLV